MDLTNIRVLNSPAYIHLHSVMSVTMALKSVQWGVLLIDVFHYNTGDPSLAIQHICQPSLGSERNLPSQIMKTDTSKKSVIA